MIRSFFGKFSASAASDRAWPQSRIVAVLNRQYEAVDLIGQDDGFVLYGISDNGVNFVVALIEAAREQIAEIGFMARFVGFPVSDTGVETINRNLHISVAGLEDGDLYLLAGVEATGAFDEGTFTLVLEAWRRDLMMVLHQLSGGGASLAAAFPAARSAAAREFAANPAPAREGSAAGVDLLKAFLGGESKTPCADCGGRGKRGLIARTCSACEGSGFTSARR